MENLTVDYLAYILVDAKDVLVEIWKEMKMEQQKVYWWVPPLVN